jgi:hypothetical protein
VEAEMSEDLLRGEPLWVTGFEPLPNLILSNLGPP